MARIGLIAPYEEIYNQSIKLFNSDECLVKMGDLNGALDIAREMINDGVEVIISRAATASCIKNEFSEIPVVDIEIGSYDISRAINEAKKTSSDIALIVYEEMLCEDVGLSELHDVNINIDYVKNIQEAKDAVCKAKIEGYRIFVGGKSVRKISDQVGVKCVIIESGNESIVLALKQANAILESKDEVSRNLDLITGVIENTSVGILVISKNNRIKLANKKAKEIFKYDTNMTVGYDISTYFDLDNIVEDEDSIVEIADEKLLVHKKTQNIGSIDISSIITVEKLVDINEKERKIKSEYVNRGYKAKYTFDDILGKSKDIKEVIEISKKYASVNSTVLIHGETGTGKELFAQSIHNYSDRKKQAFVAVNCAALTESLLESEVFGYEKGSFTGALSSGKAGLFEMADGGTIFFDEIAEISLSVQAKLLRVIQEREVVRIGGSRVIPIDIRIIAATNKNLLEMVENGLFRSDLYYRLSILRINVPPLIERKDDVKLLFDFFTDYYCNYLNMSKPTINDKCYELLKSHKWPGNIRELRSVVERLVIVYEGKVILPDMMRKFIDDLVKPMAKETSVEEIRTLLEKNKNNKTLTAKELGISRTTLWKMLKEEE